MHIMHVIMIMHMMHIIYNPNTHYVYNVYCKNHIMHVIYIMHMHIMHIIYNPNVRNDAYAHNACNNNSANYAYTI